MLCLHEKKAPETRASEWMFNRAGNAFGRRCAQACLLCGGNPGVGLEPRESGTGFMNG